MARREFDDIIEERRSQMDPDKRARFDRRAEELTTAALTGYTVQLAREDAGLTQQELARRLGTAQSAISRIEAGKARVTVESLAAVAAALGDSFSVRIGRHEARLLDRDKRIIPRERALTRRAAGERPPKPVAAAASAKPKTKGVTSGGKKSRVTPAKTGGSGRPRATA